MSDFFEIQSSMIKGYQYDPNAWELILHFHNGDLYKYNRVNPHVVSGFLLSESKGSYFNNVIKGRFESSKVDFSN